MGVMACDRNNCNNVMCDHYIRGMYVCHDCLSDFEDFVGFEDRTEKKFIKLFNDFIKSDKKLGTNRIISLNQFLGRNED